jgi:adenine deaminase
MPETGKGLNSYIASGIRCCHESTRAEDALAKMRLGMYAMIREGSAWRDLKEVIKSITQNKIDSRFAVLISDDTHPNTLISQGHMDHIVRRAIEEGADPLTAIQMVTINCAQCFQMDHELGSITPGKCADIVFLNKLEDVSVTRVLINGKVVSEDGRMIEEFEPYTYPDWVTKSMHIATEITTDSFVIKADGDSVTVKVIEVLSGKVGNLETSAELKAIDGKLVSDVSQDVLKTVVFERHHKTGTAGYGFVKGFGINCGAMASTVAHDAHNLLVVGTNDDDMALAANTLIEQGGGMAIVQNGKVLGKVPLPIAGLMNDKPAEEMADLVAELEKAWAQIGCTMVSPFMTMALIPLACLPELRLTNRGLVDCTTFSFVDLIKE